VTSIGSEAFARCALLNEVTVPVNTTEISDNAFEDCKRLTICGAAGSYAEQYAKDRNIPFKATSAAPIPAPSAQPAPAQPANKIVAPSGQKVIVNGKSMDFDAYNIEGYNYFKLIDLAYALSGTAKQFDVSYDSAKNAVVITSGGKYAATGAELTKGSGGSKSVSASSQNILLNGKQVNWSAYNIDGRNYFMLKDIALAFGFIVSFDGETNSVKIDTTAGN
jgi:predicted kinase